MNLAGSPGSACRICGNAVNNTPHVVREMLYGTKEAFDYLECADCGCIQLQTVPADLARHYPRDYGSFVPTGPRQRSGLALRGRRVRARHYLGQRDLTGSVLAALSKRPQYFEWLAGWGLDVDSRFLDVGCGTGALLLRMAGDGFRHLSGVDPFVDADIAYENGVRIHRKTIDELEGEFDFIMLHHSFEHMTDPLAALGQLRRLLHPGGTILMRLPVADCYAWRKYRTCWYALDAPRHIFLHTTRSMHHLAGKAGFRVARQFRDSTSQQFITSELYMRGISMQAANSSGAIAKLFSERDIETFKKRAAELNASYDGDCAGFFLKRLEP